MKYKFDTHFKGIGQNEYLSQGKHNYQYGVDITTEYARFSLGERPIHLAKLGNNDFGFTKKILGISGWIYALSQTGDVWYVAPAPTASFMGASYDSLNCPAGTIVASTATSAVNMEVFANTVYVFIQDRLYSKATSSVNGSVSWGSMTDKGAITSSSYHPTANYLDSKMYFGNGVTLGRVDEFGIVTQDVIGRSFDSPIVALTLTGSVLNIYTRDGKKSFMDLSSEEISETVDLKTTIRGAVSDSNMDYIITTDGNYGQIPSGSSFSIASGYDKKEILRSLKAETLGKYQFLTGFSHSTKLMFDYGNGGLIANYNGAIYMQVQDLLSAIFMFKNGALSSVFPGKDQSDTPLNSLNAIYPTASGVYIGFRAVNGYHYIAQIGLGYAARKSALVENVFVGPSITDQKSLKEIKLRADVPAGTRLKIFGVFDKGEPEMIAEITETSRKTHTYKFPKDFYEMMLIYEMYNDTTDYTSANITNKVHIYDAPVIDFDIIGG